MGDNSVEVYEGVFVCLFEKRVVFVCLFEKRVVFVCLFEKRVV